MNYPAIQPNPINDLTLTANENDTFLPYAKLQRTYGEDLGKLTSMAILQSITALGFSLTNDLEVVSIIRCGSYYDELKKHPVLKRVISDSTLTEWERTNLVAFLAQTL